MMEYTKMAKRPAFTVMVAAAMVVTPGRVEAKTEQPNIVILFADDMGYGDLNCYGNPLIDTPNLDQLAEQGMRLTSFVTGSWCVPSRTQLMTGRYLPRVKSESESGGLLGSEVTMAEALKEAGYATGMAGKWHLGFRKDKYLPVNHGFDSWIGTARSNDFRKPWVQTDIPLGMYRGTEMIDKTLDQDKTIVTYTSEAIDFIEEESGDEEPFFFYLAYNQSHLPIHTAERFRGQSDAGLYGDVVETIDWSVGQITKALAEQGVAENTIVFFATDNGPWLNLPDRMLQDGNKPWHQGTTGPLRGAKATTYEGGTRVPAIFRWPAEIEPNQKIKQLIGMPDIYHTMVKAGGGELPEHTLDGNNLLPFLKGETDEVPEERYYYFRNGLEAMRDGKWKLRTASGEPQLFNMVNDPYERFNRADDKPKIVKRMRQEMEAFAKEVGTHVQD